VVTKAWLKLANKHKNRAPLIETLSFKEKKKRGPPKKQKPCAAPGNSMARLEYKEAAVRREEEGCENYGNGEVARPETCQVFVDVFVHECVCA